MPNFGNYVYKLDQTGTFEIGQQLETFEAHGHINDVGNMKKSVNHICPSSLR